MERKISFTSYPVSPLQRLRTAVVRQGPPRSWTALVCGYWVSARAILVASPPILYPDFYGIDMPSKDELIASTMSIEQMRRFLGVTSLSFISLDGFYSGLGVDKRDATSPQFADHCFTGHYPTRLVDHDLDRSAKDEQLSLLDD